MLHAPQANSRWRRLTIVTSAIASPSVSSATRSKILRSRSGIKSAARSRSDSSSERRSPTSFMHSSSFAFASSRTFERSAVVAACNSMRFCVSSMRVISSTARLTVSSFWFSKTFNSLRMALYCLSLVDVLSSERSLSMRSCAAAWSVSRLCTTALSCLSWVSRSIRCFSRSASCFSCALK